MKRKKTHRCRGGKHSGVGGGTIRCRGGKVFRGGNILKCRLKYLGVMGRIDTVVEWGKDSGRKGEI